MPSTLTVVLVSLLWSIPAISFWLWLVILPARVAILCPEGCKCDGGGYFINCSNTSLNSVPLIRLTNVRVLLLEENNITLFERDSFVTLTELDLLYVYSCGLRTIELGSFNGLTTLRKLYINYNEISEILPCTFENMSNLEILDLSYNKLEHLDSDMLSGLIKLKVIYLSRNELQYLHPETFLLLPSFEHLGLYINPTLHIPTDRPFIKSHSLSHLDIGGCNVHSLSVETFSNVSALEWLDLDNNSLSTVDINILRALPKLSKLYLYGNPLQCDCQLQEVWRWCEDRDIQTAWMESTPECDTPREVNGLW